MDQIHLLAGLDPYREFHILKLFIYRIRFQTANLSNSISAIYLFFYQGDLSIERFSHSYDYSNKIIWRKIKKKYIMISIRAMNSNRLKFQRNNYIKN